VLAPGAVLLAAFTLLPASSARQTVDPVSRAMWGTFRLARHELLNVKSWAATCCAYGLCQAVYNLELLRFADLMQATLNRPHPIRDRGLVFAVPLRLALGRHGRRGVHRRLRDPGCR
jgi:hypothetical protein